MRRQVALGALLLAALALAAEAEARVGGGQGFGNGGGGFSGGGGGGGDDGDAIALILWLLIRLCIEYPEIGIPLLLLFLAFLAVRAVWTRGQQGRQVHRVRRALDPATGPAPRARDAARGARALLAEADPGFSEPVLFEVLQLVHRRALHARCTGEWAPLAPFVADGVREALTRILPEVREIRDVVHAGIRLEGARRVGKEHELRVVLLGSRVEVRPDAPAGASTYFEERWVFRRGAEARSLPPEDAIRLGCPSCGAAIETDEMGACRYCHTPINRGQLQWQAREVSLLVSRPARPPELGVGGGDEPGVFLPTVSDPSLPAAWRAFTARHPDFRQDAFKDRVGGVFLALQAAWSAGRWEQARPHVTDPLYETLRFTLSSYAEHGLRNRVEEVQLERLELVKVAQDAWYESITVRLWARSLDWVEDTEGRVRAGSQTGPRRFSEYWTFLRAAGTGAAAGDPKRCPSCGATLDRVNAAGVCGYCDSRITSGRFDWVLSRIDQPQVYQG